MTRSIGERMAEMPVVEHLSELRRVLLMALVFYLMIAVACWWLVDRVLELLLVPLAELNLKLVYIGVPEAFFTKIKLCLVLGFIAALPIFLFQFWLFLRPALYRRERIYVSLFLVFSYLLFTGGIAFSYLTIYQWGVKFLLHFGGEELLPMLTMGKYVSFATMFILPFGLLFQLPLAMVLLALMGFISSQGVARRRRYAVLVAVVVASALVPSPDIITVILAALPLYLLFEGGLLLVRLVEWQRRRAEKKRSESDMLELAAMQANAERGA